MSSLLRRLAPSEVSLHRQDPVDAATLAKAATIVNDVRKGGLSALRQHSEAFGDVQPGAPLVLDKAALEKARNSIPSQDLALLERTAERIRVFALAQRDCLREMDVTVPGGRAGHHVTPVERAGCYAPGGRFPLPSSVLMTAVTARAAGVREVWVASPRPNAMTQAAAAVAGADAMLCVGGAQAIAALAFGAGPVPPCDAVVGPGNRWVTAAKQLVAGRVAIDMLAGPSELVVLADASANPAVVAADLLAQAEHDPDAFAALVTLDAGLADAVDRELVVQLQTLPTAATAQAALKNGFCVVVPDLAAGVAVCNTLAPEHLEVQLADNEPAVNQLQHFGGLFVGRGAAEVFGDYGVGPNHVLPTSGSARHTGGLSVLNFLRVRTWLEMEALPEIIDDVVALARHEGLEAHARAALARKKTRG